MRFKKGCLNFIQNVSAGPPDFANKGDEWKGQKEVARKWSIKQLANRWIKRVLLDKSHAAEAANASQTALEALIFGAHSTFAQNLSGLFLLQRVKDAFAQEWEASPTISALEC
jgi:hypothetical protein